MISKKYKMQCVDLHLICLKLPINYDELSFLNEIIGCHVMKFIFQSQILLILDYFREESEFRTFTVKMEQDIEKFCTEDRQCQFTVLKINQIPVNWQTVNVTVSMNEKQKSPPKPIILPPLTDSIAENTDLPPLSSLHGNFF